VIVGPGEALERHGAQVRRELDLLDYPRRPWMPSAATPGQGGGAFDVVIVGAGQGGLACAFGLARERISNVLVVDENPLDRAGPWLSFARMRTLRTPKYLTGPDLGVPSLTPRAWFEAQHGVGSWEELGLIPKETWAAYLAWYRQTLDIPVRPETRVGALRWSGGAWEIPCVDARTGAAGETLRARRVVLATGIDGSGAWDVPGLIREGLPAHLWAHTRQAIDFEALRGKRVAVLGAGASAFDNAATALEHGAREVVLCFRRPRLVDVNAYRWAEFVGFLRHHGELPDADKWRFIRQIVRMGQLPPADTVRRARAHGGLRLHGGCDWSAVEARGDGARIVNASGEAHDVDFVIVGTGFVTDLARRPELREIERHIARWADRFTPPPGEESDDLLRHPYLGPGFEHTEKVPGEAPYLRTLYNYTFGGLLSLGFGGASISGMKYSIPRLVGAITGSFFVEDREAHFAGLRAFAEKEL
jgi:cation diffusion facilitator CzcD-associated flavoprotein CzcO